MRIDRVLTLASAAFTGLILTGCAQESAPPVIASRSQLQNDTAVTARGTEESALPNSVGAAFHRDFKDAGVTRVTPGTTETGQPFYRVTYISRDGIPGSVSYYLDGTRMSGPAGSEPNPPPTKTPYPPSGTPRIGQP
jgi:hypothetical protein